MGAPDQHFEKLVQAEKQIQAAASEKKQLLIANKEALFYIFSKFKL